MDGSPFRMSCGRRVVRSTCCPSRRVDFDNMALTLRALLGERALGLRARAGEDALDRPIGWVHPTELTDPQAFLEGGELLLTTGLALGDGTSPDYVRRLVEAGVARLGFGVGLSHDDVPRALVATAAEVGL